MSLASILGQKQQLVLMSLDRVAPLADQLGLLLDQTTDRALLETFIGAVARVYSPRATGVSLSPELGYSVAAQIEPSAGTVFCLERTRNELDPLSVPILQSNWSLEYVRNNAGVAKLLVYARSDESELITKLDLVNELYDASRYEGVGFIIELRVIDGKRLGDEAFQAEQLRLIRLFRDQADLFLLEYPRSALGCLAVTAQLQRPWALLEPGTKVAYPDFKEQLRTALTSGAQGLAVSQLLLPTFARGTGDLAKLREYCQKEGRDRLLELARICEEAIG